MTHLHEFYTRKLTKECNSSVYAMAQLKCDDLILLPSKSDLFLSMDFDLFLNFLIKLEENTHTHTQKVERGRAREMV